MRKHYCSECGYSNTSAKAVVEHIDKKHEHKPEATVKSYETDADEEKPPSTAFAELIDRIKRWLVG